MNESRTVYQDLVESIDGIIYEVDTSDFHFTFVSPQSEHILGYLPTYWLEHLAWHDLIHPDDLIGVFDYWVNAVERKQSYRLEFRMMASDGRVVWVEDVATVLTDDEKPVRIRGVLHDITERKRKEQHRTESEHRLHAILETEPECVKLLDANGTVLDMNPAGLAMIGATRKEQVVGKSAYDMVAPEYHTLYRETNEAVFRGESRIAEFEIISFDGARRNMESHACPLRDKEGHIVAQLAITRDVTEQKRAEQSLNEQKALYETLLKAQSDVGEGFIIVEGKQIIYINDAFSRISGYTLDDLRELPSFFYLIVRSQRQLLIDRLRRRLRGEDVPDFFETTFLHKEGRQVQIEMSVKLVDWGKDKRGVAIIRDLTQRKQAERELLRLQEQYKHIFDHALEGMYRTTPDGRYLNANLALARLYGYDSPEELIQTITDIGRQIYVNPKDREEFKRRLAEFGEVRNFEHRVYKKDGAIIWISANARAVYDDQKNILYYDGFLVDVTERKRAERALKASEQRYRTLVERMSEGIIQVDNDDVILFVNEKFCEMSGYTREELLGKESNQLLLFEEDREVLKEKNRMRTMGISEQYELRLKKKTGDLLWVEINAAPITNLHGGVIGSIGIQTDITERKRTEAREAVFATLVQRLNSAKTSEQAGQIIAEATDTLFHWDAFTFDVYAAQNDIVHSILNIDTIDDRKIDVPPTYTDRQPTERMRRVMITGGELILRDDLYRMPQDSIPFGDVQRPSASLMIVPIHDEKNVVGLLSVQSYQMKAFSQSDLVIFQTVADHCGGALNRIRAQEALQQSEERFRRMAENIREVFWMMDPAREVVLYVSPAFDEIWGRSHEEILGHPSMFFDTIHPEDRALVASYDERRPYEAYEIQFRIVRPDGAVRRIRDRVFPVQDEHGQVVLVTGIAEDITDRVQLEEHLRQTQKMESLGTLAGGIAHDFNNILGIIMGYTSAFQLSQTNATVSANAAAAITKAVQRGANLVRQILTLARKTELSLEPVNVNHAIDELAQMLQDTFPRTIEISLDLDPTHPVVSIDSSQLHQALLNLCVNARDAMPKGGILLLRTKIVRGEQLKKRFPNVERDVYVRLSIADNGIGMEEETRRRIFEPFFTTKEFGKGTGLGLAVVYGIVQNQQGFIDVESEVGSGTTFYIYLPIASAESAQSKGAEGFDLLPTGTETLLLVEDEDDLRSIVKGSLERQGFKVYATSDGESGIKLYQQMKDKIDLALLDVGLPKLSGADVATVLRAINPHLKIIIASGYFSKREGEELQRLGINEFVQKPYEIKEVLQKIRSLLDIK